MRRRSIPSAWRPGLRAGVLAVCATLVTGTALAVSANVSDHLARTAVDEAVRTTEAVVRGDVDPLVSANGLSTAAGDKGGAIDAQLSRLVAAGKILRIKIWAPDMRSLGHVDLDNRSRSSSSTSTTSRPSTTASATVRATSF